MIKVIICNPCFFEQELQEWCDEQDKKFPEHITDFEIIKITDFTRNNKIAHYIKYSLKYCD